MTSVRWLGSAVRYFLALFVLAGCGDGDSPKAKHDAAPGAEGQFVIRGYHETAGKLHRIAYLPAEASALSKPNQKVVGAPKAPGVQAQAYQRCRGTNCGAGGTYNAPIEGGPAEGQLFSGDQLLQDIGESCAHPPPLDGARVYHPVPDFQTAWDGDNRSTRWYIFTEKGRSCDELLQKEEVLLCMADRLASIADAVNTVRFEAEALTLVFPPQELKDKFIVRDLALNVLAHLALLDAERPTGWDFVDNSLLGVLNCSEAYGKVYEDPNLVLDDEAQGEYAAVLAPASANPNIFTDHFHRNVTGVRDDVRFRSKLKGHILGAAGILLRNLIDKSVLADLAGAETRRGQAGDERKALERMWGVGDDAVGPYD